MEKRTDTILVQGAMELEIAYLRSCLQDVKPVTYAGFLFWQGQLGNKNIVLGKTGIGTALAGASTALALEHFAPSLILNQGTAGAYAATLTYGDIVLGAEVFNGNAVYTSPEGKAHYIDLTNLENESSFSKMFLAKPKYFTGAPCALNKALEVAPCYQEGKVLKGVIASFDQWNMEPKKIKKLQLETGALCEEMEAGGAAAVAASCKVPFLAVRVISNNNTVGTAFKGETALMCQKFVEILIKAL